MPETASQTKAAPATLPGPSRGDGTRQLREPEAKAKKPRKPAVRKSGGYRVWAVDLNGDRVKVVKELPTVGKMLRWVEENGDIISMVGVEYDLERYYDLNRQGKPVPAA